MLRKSSIIFLCAVGFSFAIFPDDIKLTVSAQKFAKMNLAAFVVGSDTAQAQELLSALTRAMEFSGQWKVTQQVRNTVPRRKEITALWDVGIPYAVFIEFRADGVNWRLYETQQATMIKGKKIALPTSPVRAWGYALADALWVELMGSEAFFSCKIAYCKNVAHGKNKHYKHIYIADFDGSHAESLVTTPTINISPRWNKDYNRPLLFYSENTSTNVRMMASTLDRKRIMASNFEGINTQPAFSPDGTTVVYCATRGSGTGQLLCWHNKKLMALTHNQGINIFPCFSDDGKTLYFCSDFEYPTPLIYAYDCATKAVSKLTHDGYCVSPSYCGPKDSVVYCKMVHGIMQLFSYSCKTKIHKQLTFDEGQKQECMVAPGGLMVLCVVAHGASSRIAYYNLNTGVYHYLTPTAQHCSYPALSGNYAAYPVVT